MAGGLRGRKAAQNWWVLWTYLIHDQEKNVRHYFYIFALNRRISQMW